MNSLMLLVLFFCHFLADFTPLSTAWMLGAKKFGKPIHPIFLHACVHGTLMGVALKFFMDAGDLWALLCVFQIASHFIVDVFKGRANGWFPILQSPANKWHWVIFGFDQFLHASIIILMVNLSSK